MKKKKYPYALVTKVMMIRIYDKIIIPYIPYLWIFFINNDYFDICLVNFFNLAMCHDKLS